jgi:hypothetical protein
MRRSVTNQIILGPSGTVRCGGAHGVPLPVIIRPDHTPAAAAVCVHMCIYIYILIIVYYVGSSSYMSCLLPRFFYKCCNLFSTVLPLYHLARIVCTCTQDYFLNSMMVIYIRFVFFSFLECVMCNGTLNRGQIRKLILQMIPFRRFFR